MNRRNNALADGNARFSIGEDANPYITYKVGADTVTKKLCSNFSDSYKFTTKSGSVSTRSVTIESITDHVYIVFMRTGFISAVSQITPTNCEILGFNAIATGSNYYDDVFIVKATDSSFKLTVNSDSGYFSSIRYVDLVPNA